MDYLEKKASKDQLKLIYLDILNGYTVANSKEFGTMYIKHVNLESSGLVDEHRARNLDKAKEQGLPGREEQLEYLKKEGLWKSEQEQELRDLDLLMKGLNQSKQKVFLQAQIDYFNQEIEKSEKRYDSLLAERESLFGYTAESYAIKKVNEFYIFLSMYKNKNTKVKYFTQEEFDEINSEKLIDLVTAYNKATVFFNSTNLKRIALSTFFLNYFYLCEDNPFTFFGKPVIDLSYHQVELFGHARHFKHALSNMKGNPPDELYDAPEKLEEWINSGKNADKMMEKAKAKNKEHGASSIVGATTEDLKRLGYTFENNTEVSKTKLSESANNSGKDRLSFEDLIKIHEGKKLK